MANNLWSILDAWQIAQIEAALGAGGSYADLHVQTITTAILNDVDDWQIWAMPAIVIQGSRKRRRPGPHGDAYPHFELEYPYTWAAITRGTRAQSLADVKEIEKRLETAGKGMIQTIQTNATTNPDERARRMTIGDADALQFRADDAGDQWYSVAFVQVDIFALA